ncbi:MAG TPA: prolyl oligopeptidase family serine peptidase [Rudaea sp.]|jgi:dipeptidyl aminopeptidase/acylaminoacyl peptidase
MQRLLAGVIALTVFASAPAQTAPLTLEQIMADPDWIGAQIDVPEPFDNHGVAPYFGADGRSVYYHVKRRGSPLHDLHRVDLADGKDNVVDAAAMASADGGQMVFDTAHTRAAFVRNGDVFLRELSSGRLVQVTRTPADETGPQFSADGAKLSYHSGNDWFVYDIASGVAAPAAILKTEKDPDAPPAKADELRDMQLRLFSTLKKVHDDKKTTREHAEQMQKDDASRAPLPFYLGDEVQLAGTVLAPDARHLLAVTTVKGHDDGKKGKLTRYVTESGYEEFEDERTRVGRNDPAPQTLWLFDLAAHTKTQLAYNALSGIHDDPLKSVREENARQNPAKTDDSKAEHRAEQPSALSPRSPENKEEPKTRPIEVMAIHFSRDGANAAVELRAMDNKDRWIASVAFAKPALESQHRLHDDAWINWNFNEFGWEHDNRTLWYVSEETGYAQLYAKPLGGKAHALTQGKFEVSHPKLSQDGRWFYLHGNVQAPYAYDVYRVAVDGGELQRVTHFEGAASFSLSPDDRQLLVLHSSGYLPPQLAVAPADGSGTPRELTDTRSAEYKALQWVAPKIVAVPSTHFKGSIWAKFYGPADFDKSTKHPAVIFVHGAGYTQNVHEQWPYYFREQMFHNLLLQHGYVVLDMDYRASEGYGRDWRTAIYRQMGHPELEDLLDGKHWLVDNWSVDPKRIGIYGGSYGGFMTLMALFRAPGEFAAGAALRPVTDWTQYNHDYTANILNDPQLDPIAYARSSPLEFADGLKDSLLICHGVIDDNVLFEDSMRLYQRLIELHKDDFTISPYPLDRHGFVNADSWLDEYKRIYRLFDRTIGNGNR